VRNRRAIWLGALTGCGLVAVLIALFVVPGLLYPPLSAAVLRELPNAQARIQLQQAQSQLASSARSAALQGLAGLVVVVGVAATWWQVHVSREGQITERFTKAVDQLSSGNVIVRIGGIYALERIARNSATDRDHILFLLGAFVRNHAPWPANAPGARRHRSWRPHRRLPRARERKTGSMLRFGPVDWRLPWMRTRAADIQAAMGTLGRLPRSAEEPVLSLSRVDLRSLALRGSHLSDARFRHANFARSVLEGVWLERSDLTGADLRHTRLSGGHFAGANLAGATLQEANLRSADLSHADLRGTDLSGANLDGATLTGAQAYKTTIWPASMDTANAAGSA
jgi:Pentapeptide repeats (8 copies)